jgi:hypothetical protein
MMQQVTDFPLTFNKGSGDMSPSINSKTLPTKILDHAIRKAVITAIKQEHVNISAAIKSVAAVTGINANAIAKWHSGRNTPSTAHFLTLAMFYPSVLQTLLSLIGRGDLWDMATREHLPSRMRDSLAARHAKYQNRGDILRGSDKEFLNERQLWFVETLQRLAKMQNKHIAAHWKVNLRTAKRDTEKLIAAGIVCSVRKGGTGWYELRRESNH